MAEFMAFAKELQANELIRLQALANNNEHDYILKLIYDNHFMLMKR